MSTAKEKIWRGIIYIEDRKVLMTRESDEDYFGFPGGGKEGNETEEETLKREVKEELGVNLVSFELFNEYRLPGRNSGEIRFSIYMAEIEKGYKPSSNIEEVKWVDSSYKENDIEVGAISKYVYPDLKSKGLID